VRVMDDRLLFVKLGYHARNLRIASVVPDPAEQHFSGGPKACRPSDVILYRV
jgi:hypothetical protein